MNKSSAISKRRTKAVESFGSAAECIGKTEKDMSLFAITRGQFSMLDAINVVLKQTPNANISVWTWAIADYEVECFEAFMKNKEIKGAILVIDRSAENRNSDLIQKWRDRFGNDSVHVCKNHAKIARVWNEDFHFLLRGSMNLNFNPRFEQLDITEGGAEYDLIEKIENELPVLQRNCDNYEAVNASQLNMAFSNETLKTFSGVKVWAK